MQREIFESCYFLTGPTGAGKSALSLELAEELSGEIVALDSMTLYRGMDIGTAKPDAESRDRVPHHLIDVLDPWESASVAWWLEQAAACIREIQSRGNKVLFVGGTPLYLKAVFSGLFKGPPANAAIRAELTETAKIEGANSLHRRLQIVDPIMAARLHPNDERRIVRALEVKMLTGKPMSLWQQEWAVPTRPWNGPKVLCLDVPRAELHDRIDARVVQMHHDGWLDEVRQLQSDPRGLSPEAMQAVGYQECKEHLAGTLAWDAMIQRIQARSRQYAKRQMTWFRHLPYLTFVSNELTFPSWGLRIGK